MSSNILNNAKIILVVFSFVITYNYLNKIKIYSSNEEFIMALLNNSNHHINQYNSS